MPEGKYHFQRYPHAALGDEGDAGGRSKRELIRLLTPVLLPLATVLLSVRA
jgi:hypothetical protein